MKKIRYRFKSKEILVVRVKDILSKPVKKLPKWVQDALGKPGHRRLLWIADNRLHYWTNYGNCTLELRPQDYLLRVPCPEYWGKNVWEITGYVKEKFRKNIERF